jgi:hypothetical protein
MFVDPPVCVRGTKLLCFHAVPPVEPQIERAEPPIYRCDLTPELWNNLKKHLETCGYDILFTQTKTLLANTAVGRKEGVTYERDSLIDFIDRDCFKKSVQNLELWYIQNHKKVQAFAITHKNTLYFDAEREHTASFNETKLKKAMFQVVDSETTPDDLNKLHVLRANEIWPDPPPSEQKQVVVACEVTLLFSNIRGQGHRIVQCIESYCSEMKCNAVCMSPDTPQLVVLYCKDTYGYRIAFATEQQKDALDIDAAIDGPASQDKSDLSPYLHNWPYSLWCVKMQSEITGPRIDCVDQKLDL